MTCNHNPSCAAYEDKSICTYSRNEQLAIKKKLEDMSNQIYARGGSIEDRWRRVYFDCIAALNRRRNASQA